MNCLKTSDHPMKRDRYEPRDPVSMILIFIVVLFVLAIVLIVTRVV